MTTKYRVTYMESERGWGQKYYTVDYDTPELARDAIRQLNDDNKAEWHRTRVVPDYYIQPSSEDIVMVEV